MIYESPSDPALTDWLNICEFEALFWEESLRIQTFDRALANERPYFVQQHPSSSHSGPGAKHVDEWLPLLLFGKHISGDMRHWDSTLEVCATRTGSGDPKTANGCSFDAMYRMFSNQPHISPDREGYLEITRAMNPRQGADLVRHDRELSRVGVVIESYRPFSISLQEVEREVKRAVLRKAAKNYEPDTTLIIWLRDEPPALGKRLQDKDLHRDIQRLSDGVFANVCCVGLKTGISWLLGSGL
ncbi:hypothetical protein [Cohaesibacter haloalkalitolerans]|uniref:hypothetical protein n=1 Tax=Cohaesibacter haloalkalitolerans TaxID=1162980 RepID=UPI0013C52224|nr:hypothetical protein [Cohaesibacter haloalkalitolerans]